MNFLEFVLLCIFLVGGLGLIVFFLVIPIGNELHQMKEYTKFCLERPDFCYCGIDSCEYKISQTYINGLQTSEDNNTKELCNLATELKDEEILWKANCYN